MEITEREIKSFEERKFPSEICFKPIGIIHSQFNSLKGIPIQPSMSEAEGIVEIFPEFSSGLKDLNGFSHVFCIYYFDMVKKSVSLQAKPFLDDEVRGVFATRSPFRPNPIGLSVLKLVKVEENKIYVKHLDILNQTPLLDIKPFVPDFDARRDDFKIGWLQGKIKEKLS